MQLFYWLTAAIWAFLLKIGSANFFDKKISGEINGTRINDHQAQRLNPLFMHWLSIKD